MTEGGDIATLNKAVFASWQEGSDFRDELGNLKGLPEHATGQDTLSLFLARLVIPATAGDPPVRSGPLDLGNHIDNDSRPFLYTPLALARFVGLLKG